VAGLLTSVHTSASWWRVDTDWKVVIDSDYRVRAYDHAHLVEGEPVEFVWAPGPRGEQRRTHSSGPVLWIDDESDNELVVNLFVTKVRRGNGPAW
jgi:hypothetical protein